MADQSLSLPLSAADALLAAHDGDLALLYLYLCRRGRIDPEQAARELCRTRLEIDAAEEKLRRLGLTSGAPAPQPPAADKPLPPADELPEYTAEELTQRKSEDRQLAHVFDEAERVFGRKLSGADLRTIFGIYDRLPLPVEVIYELLHYCAENAAARHQRLTARTIEKEAFRWNDLEILTLEQAEEHIRSQRLRQDAVQRVLPILGIRDRLPVASEQKYIAAWLDMGFDEDALAAAYDRTVTQIHKFNWNYMDKILRDWHGKNLHTGREIEAGTARAPRRRMTAGQSGTGATEGDYDFPEKL